MLSTFLNHQWKAFWRSRNKGGTIAAQIFMGLMVLYLLVLALILGFKLREMIAYFLPGKDVMFVFNGFILYYFAVDFVMRIQLQDLPTLSIVPYLHLNIPRSKIVRFLNVRAIFTAFNLFPLILFLPFCSTAVAQSYGPLTAIMYSISIIALCIFNNYTALYLKRLTINKTYLIFVVMGFIAAVGLLEYFKVFSIASISNSVFVFISKYPLAALVFPVMAGTVFFVNANYLRSNLYTEELTNGEEKKASTDYPFLDRFGEIGTLIALELKLIFRHKRPRSAVIASLIFVFYDGK
jgi:MFS family permease